MKTLGTLLLFFLLFSLTAQTYHPLVETGKRWSAYHNPCDQGNQFSEYQKFTTDTMFGGHTWKRLLSTRDSLIYPWTSVGFLREDSNRRVYFTLSGLSTKLYYDFGLSVGDTVSPYDEPLFPYVLDSITSFELVTGEFRNRYVLRLVGPYGVADSCYDYWLEGIGSLYGLMTPAFCGIVGDNPSLICSWEHDTLKYHNPDFQECYVITGIRHPASGIRHLVVYPNPATETVHIEFRSGMSSSFRFELVDLQGNSLIRKTLTHPQTKVNLQETGIKRGLYLYRISEKKRTIQTGKLIIK